MRGFQPGAARAVPQNYADGGVVSTIKGMLGFGGGKKKPEPLPADLNKMPPTGAGPAASQPEQPKKAISQYSGMSALERRMKEQGLADGGLVRGPGTGISDEIEDDVEEGTFIMPADSTEAMGKETMEKLGNAKVPVNLSNGEAKLPPEALQAIGAEVMEAIKNVTHTPAAVQAQGFPGAQESAATRNFADGGVVRKEERPRTLADLARSPGYGAGAGGPVSTPPAATAKPTAPTQPQPQPSPSVLSTDPQAQSDRAKIGAAWDTIKDMNNDAGRAIADVATLVPRGLVGAYDSAVVRPMRAAGFNADYLSPKLVPEGVDPASMTPFTDQKRMAQQTPAQASTPSAATSPAAPRPAAVAVSNPSNAGAGRGSINPERVNPSAPPPKSPDPQAAEVSPGVFRVGNSFGDSAQAAVDGARPSAGPSARNMEAMNNLVARDPVAGAMDRALGREQAPSVRGMPQAPGQAPAPRASTASPATAAQAAASTSTPPVTRGFPAASQPTDVMGIYSRASDALKGVADAQRALDDYGPRMSGGGDLLKGGRSSQQQFQQDSLRTSLVQQAQQGGRGAAAAMQALNGMEGNQIAKETAQMREQGDTARFNAREQGETARAGMRESGENARSGRRDALASELGRGQLDLQRSAQGFTTRQAERQERLYAEYESAKTPEEQSAVARKIAALAGKTTDPKDNFMVVGGGQEWDASAGAMRNVPQRLVDLRTGQEVGATGQAGKPAPAPADPKERKVGSVYVAPNGTNVRWTGHGWQQA